MRKAIHVRPIQKTDQTWVKGIISEHFGSPRVVSHGKLHNVIQLPGLVAIHAENPIGLLHYHIESGQCEVVTIISLFPKHGIGRRLLEETKEIARAAGCERVWLITTNDNLSAQAFYQHLGWRQVVIHQNAVQESRKLKPEIPEFGEGGVPIRDEIEFELKLGDER